MTKKVAVIVGSLRKDSYNRKIAKNLIAMAPDDMEMEMIEIGNLPLYNEDYDAQVPPKEYTEFRKKLKEKDAILFVTPEYNRSMPGVLKNAIDVGSRPYGQSVWDGKVAAVVSSSPGAIAGFGANQHLRLTFVFLNLIPMQQPEAYLAQVHEMLNEDGTISNEETKKFLQNYMNSFDKFIDKVTC